MKKSWSKLREVELAVVTIKCRGCSVKFKVSGETAASAEKCCSPSCLAKVGVWAPMHGPKECPPGWGVIKIRPHRAARLAKRQAELKREARRAATNRYFKAKKAAEKAKLKGSYNPRVIITIVKAK